MQYEPPDLTAAEVTKAMMLSTRSVVDWLLSLGTVRGGLAYFWENDGGFHAALAPVSSIASTASWLGQGACCPPADIVRMVEAAQARTAPVQRFADVVAVSPLPHLLLLL
ncbi:hypothetical protein ACK3TF_000294 [Chlorella vulgaris]